MEKTALLIIDAQVGIIEGTKSTPVYRKENLLKIMGEIIGTARSLNVPLVYIQDLDVADPSCDDFQIHSYIAPIESDKIITKKATDAFHLTGLNEYLIEKGIFHLVVVGCKTEYCVDSTCRRATTLGFDVTLVSDGHSTTDNKVLNAEKIIAHHNCNLHGLDNVNHFIMVRSSEENVFDHKHLEYK
ncbi:MULTISPECIES: cysteine hydrolase family protein [unclassified Bacillus (in: firmicutes)]|uniref:cysteine hydrolase family protein n=1 Tax=unclassified Bacillus (in: firmicutes) TaxID=185979 RepID=UPI0008E6CB0A|nr:MULTISPECIES: cysteine hydrolase family protein [unclassified Bacillus (in: firmicutes)]SFB23292.1 Nicotinamidase-related amidase [Bacillus sp. UNCCL13]SFQ87713.1 Nicotinamidase-related amidase [Bacillus sp. cl95]